jgi:hypothetical protein
MTIVEINKCLQIIAACVFYACRNFEPHPASASPTPASRIRMNFCKYFVNLAVARCGCGRIPHPAFQPILQEGPGDDIQHKLNGGEVAIGRYKVDGQSRIDPRIVYEYNGFVFFI